MELSILSLVASAIYLMVACSAFYAGSAAKTSFQPNWQRWVWFGAGVFFLALIVWRVLAVEDIIRAEMREILRTSNVYQGRREFQSAIAAMILALLAVAAFAALYRARRVLGGRRNLLSLAVLAGCAAMLMLIALRLVSFHWIDVILDGYLKVNWLADLGISLGIAIAAFFYVKLVRIRR